jgi:hypothetical protein
MNLPLGSALILNPWVIGVAVAALIASHGAVGYKAFRLGQNDIIAETSKLIDQEVRTRDAAIAAAAEAISKIEVRNVTVRQKAETITREVPVYRDCRHDGDGLRLINQALTDADEPAGGGKLPAADPAGRR